MKTKLQILKESTIYIFTLGFFGTILYFIVTSFLDNDSWIPLALSGLLSLVATCVLMGYLFEKEKPLWIAFIQYMVIGIFSALFTLIIIAIGFPFVFDFMLNQTSDFFKKEFAGGGISGLFLIIPLLLLSFLFLIFGVLAYLVITYFLGNWIFSFLLQWALNRYNFNSTKKKSGVDFLGIY
ncbi:MAG: hypothetical protein IPL26_26040 [Leptospiraceae bacterium]|nr:hypothetical protein [Leptospiraceae bacterium]